MKIVKIEDLKLISSERHDELMVILKVAKIQSSTPSSDCIFFEIYSWG